MADYDFVTDLYLGAPPERVWDAVWDPTAWMAAWGSVDEAREVVPPGPDGLGGTWRYTFRAPLGYTLAFDLRTRVADPPRVLEVEAVGHLEGFGRWELAPHGQGTLARYRWHVRTVRAWMNWLAPVARPVFAWNHDRIMQRGGAALAQVLGAEVLAARNLAGSPAREAVAEGLIALAARWTPDEPASQG